MKDARKGIVVAGSLIADVFYEIDTYPDQGMLTNIRDTSRNVGGSGNLILDLAKLDEHLPVEVCAIVGCDENGDYIQNKERFSFNRRQVIFLMNHILIGTICVQKYFI